jgi:hypothetical protein
MLGRLSASKETVGSSRPSGILHTRYSIHQVSAVSLQNIRVLRVVLAQRGVLVNPARFNIVPSQVKSVYGMTDVVQA